MITINYLDLIDPTIASFLEDNQADRAIDVTKKVLAAAQEDWNNGAFGHAEEVSKAYFQLSLVYSALGKDNEAAEAAKQAFLHDHFLFNQYVPIITALLKVEEPEMDDIAARAFEFFDVGLDEFHGDSDACEILLELIKEHKDRSREIYRAYKYYEYRTLVQKTNEDPECYNEVLEFIDEWEKEGGDVLECDGLRCIIYYFQDRESDVVKLWGNRSLSDAPSIIICAYIALSMITEGIELPKPIVFPDDYNVVKWFHASSIVYRRISPLVADSGLTDEIKIALEGSDNKMFFYSCVSLARQIAEQGVAIYQKFFNGEVNGTATAPFQYANFLDTQGSILGKTGQRAAGLAILEKGMEVVPHDRFAASIVDLAIDMEDSETALRAIQWRRDNMDGENVWDKTHFLDRLERWAHGLSCDTFEEYEKYINIYDEKYKELNRVMRSVVSSLLVYMYYRFDEEKKEYIYANNNNSMVLRRFFKREPLNKKVIAALLQAYARNPTDRSDFFIKENMGLIDVLRDNVVTSEDKRYLCQGLSSIGFLISVSTEEADEDHTDVSINDQALWEKGISLLDEAMEYAQDDQQREQIFIYKISLFWVVDRWEEILDLCKQGLKLLENEELKDPPENFFLKSWRANEYELADFPVALFAFYYARMFQCAEKLNRPEDEQIALGRKAFYFNPQPYMGYKLAKVLLPKALKDPDSKEYEECIDLCYFYLTLYSDEPEDEERGELLYVMGQLAIAKNRLRFAQELLTLFTLLFGNSEDLKPFKDLCESTYTKLYKKKGLLLEKNSERGEEAMTRRERSLKRLKKEKHLIAEGLSYVETIDIMRVRKAEDVIRRMLVFSKISAMAKKVLEREEFNSEAFEQDIARIKSLGLYEFLDNLEYCFLERYAERDDIVNLVNSNKYILPCAWLLGLVDAENIFDLKETHCSQLLSKFEHNGHLVLEGELRAPNEILDQLDYVFLLHESLSGQLELLEDESEIESMSENIDYVLYWLKLLNWMVDYNGVNQWRYGEFASNEDD